MPIYEGTTVDEAIRQGLTALQLTKDQANISILEEGKKGFLGIGKKAAKVKVEPIEAAVEVKETPSVTTEPELIEEKSTSEVEVEKQAEVTDKTEQPSVEVVEEALSDNQVLTQLSTYLTDISRALQAPALVKFTREHGQIIVHLQTEKQGILIGKHGKTLNALQYLAQVYVHRLTKNKLSIVINVGDYREKRQAILQRLANRTADKVLATGRPIFLEPMPAFERKQIHAALSKNKAIQTHSEGEEPYRYLVVEKAK